MRQIEKDRLKQHHKTKETWLYCMQGVSELIHSRYKLISFTVYILISFILWQYRRNIFYIINAIPFHTVLQQFIDIAFLLILSMISIIVLRYIGKPIIADKTHDNFLRIAFTNKADEYPILLSKHKSKLYSKVDEYIFYNCGIPITTWNDKCHDIEAVLRCQILGIELLSHNRIKLLTVPDKYRLPTITYWSEKYLHKKDFVLTLGESLLGQETVDLQKTSHLLIGGATNSGKTKLLKLLLMQCIKKSADVIIIDMKGGIDFKKIWHKKCRIILEREEALCALNDIIDTMKERQQMFLQHDCSNIEEYVETTGQPMNRIIVACDEVAELLIKDNKDIKEISEQIESRLSSIVRLGRATGIHLILGTQRPDHKVIDGQIRSNIFGRICGKADKILSEIILGNTEAAGKNPPDIQGRFVSNICMDFQAYMFDDDTIFDT